MHAGAPLTSISRNRIRAALVATDRKNIRTSYCNRSHTHILSRISTDTNITIMPLFGHRSTTSTRGTTSTRRRTGRFFGRKDPDRVAGGYKAALSNPNTTRSGRKHAKHELKAMGRGKEARVPLMTKIKRSLGIHSTPRRERKTLHRGL